MIMPEPASSTNIKPSASTNIWKPLAVVLLFSLVAAGFKIIFIVGRDVLPGQGARIIDGFFVLFTALAVMFFVRWVISDAPLAFLRQLTIVPLLRTLISLTLYFITAVYLLHRLAGINLTPLLTTSAVLTGIIALSLQETLKNLFTGVWINTERLVAKGDWVNIGGKEGRIMDVTWRTTRLLTFSNDYVYLPNKLLSEGHVENYTYPTLLHIAEIDIGTSYHDQPNKVKDVLIGVALEEPGVLSEPYPEVYLTAFDNFSIRYKLRVWINDYGSILKVKSGLYYNIWYAFKRDNIEMPFPVYHYYEKPISMIKSEDIETYLKGMDFFKPLSDAEIRRVSAAAKMEVYGAGEIIFRQGEKGDTCYFIKEGAVDVFLKGEAGKENYVATLEVGGFFGEMSLLTGDDRKTTVKAKKDSLLIVIDSRSFCDVFEKSPDLMESISKIVADRSVELEEVKRKIITEAEKIEAHRVASRAVLEKIRSFFKGKASA